MMIAVALIALGIAQAVPLPDALLKAKTVYVENAGVNQDVYERVVLELHQWKRLARVEQKGEADILLTVSPESVSTLMYNAFSGQTTPVQGKANRLTFKKDDETLYSDLASGCCSVKAQIRKAIERLDKRIREQERGKRR